jgi:hypothetical protein
MTAASPDDPLPWQRQRGESSKAFGYFVLYRDMPSTERSVAAAYRHKTGKTARQPPGWWTKLAQTWRWVERAQTFDDEQDRLFREASRKAIEEMADRHAKVAMLFTQHVVSRLAAIDPQELTAADLIRWFDTAVKVERLSRGEPTEIATRDVDVEITEVVVKSRQEAAEILRFQRNGFPPNGTSHEPPAS